MRPLLTATSLVLGGGAVPSNQGDVILSVPLDGGAPVTIATLSGQILNGFATDGMYVYLSDLTGLEAISLASDASPADVIPLVGGSPGPNIVGVFGQRLIFAYPQGAVDSIPLPPRPNSQVTLLGTCPAGPGDLEPCGSNACWLAGINTIEEMNPLGGAPTAITTLTGPVADTYGAAFNGADAYVIGTDVAYTSNALERVPLDGSCPVLLVRMPPYGGGSVAVDDECVYWSNKLGIFSLALTSNGAFDQ